MSSREGSAPSEQLVSHNPWSSDSEENDDDMDYELATDDMTTSAEDETEEDTEEDTEDGEGRDTTLYYDAEEDVLVTANGDAVDLGDDIIFEEEYIDEDEEEDDNDGDDVEADADGTETPQAAGGGDGQTQTIQMTQQQLLQLLSQAGFGRIIRSIGGGDTRLEALAQGDDDDDEDYFPSRRRRIRAREFQGERYPKIPSEEGARLMRSGTFGGNDYCQHTACGRPFPEPVLKKRKRLARRVLDRELGIDPRGRRRALDGLASQAMIPSSKADLIINFNARCYSGQFSDDGSFFFACGQDFKVRMYDTSNPYDWKYYKTVHYPGGQWTITDASLSPDNKFLAYSSIRSQVCLANTEQGDASDPQYLDFSDIGASRQAFRQPHGRHFGIWSLRFSGDGGEIVAGTSDHSVYVYDLEASRSILRIPGHTDDVNAVCFGDKMSPHILYSGSDDTTLKVWDRRSLASLRPAGMFLGHTEGLTYIDSKGDGRYVISNGKDQTCKLWDLRKMISTDEAEKIDLPADAGQYDYRFSRYNMAQHIPHPNDCSLVTFRGHHVVKTLIRCHFSPPGSTDGRYIYSGSHDGKIYVWNLDGTEASKPIDVLSATKNTRPVSHGRFIDHRDFSAGGNPWKTIVRDCSWHPSAPVIAATSWNGWDHDFGTCTVHSWNDGVEVDEQGDVEEAEYADGEAFGKAHSLGASPMGARVTAQLQHEPGFYARRRPTVRSGPRTRATGLARLFNPADLYDDDGEE